MPLYATDGSFNVTVVDGTTLVGFYANDGSINVVEQDGLTLTGVTHPSGAVNVVVNDGSLYGWYHPCGAWLVQETPFADDCIDVTVVSGSLGGSSGITPTMQFNDEANSQLLAVLADF